MTGGEDPAMTEAVELREVEDGDLPVLFRHQLDPEANRMAAFTREDPSDREAFDAHWVRIRNDPAITIRTVLAGGRVAGSVASFVNDGKLEVTYWLGREFWGRGIATRALARFLEIQESRPLHAAVARDNLGSRRVLEKCGFTVCGEQRGFANARGKEIEELILRLE